MIFPFLGIIGLGIAAIGCYAIFGGENYYCKIWKKEKNTQTSPKHECSYCKINPICSSCAHTEDYTFLNETEKQSLPHIVCKDCYTKDNNPMKRYTDIINDEQMISNIKIWSKNYKGNVRIDVQCELQTEKKFESKEEAIKNLKILAIWHGCNAIKNVEYIASEEQSGNYYYKLWKAKGTAGIE